MRRERQKRYELATVYICKYSLDRRNHRGRRLARMQNIFSRFMDATKTPAKVSESAQTLLRLFKREGEEMSKRVVFTFEPESLAALEKIQTDGGYDTLAATVKDALQILWAIQREAKKGYSELIVRNPKTDGEKAVLDYEVNGGNG